MRKELRRFQVVNIRGDVWKTTIHETHYIGREKESRCRVQTFWGDPKKSPIGDFRRPYFIKKVTKRRLKKESFGRLRR